MSRFYSHVNTAKIVLAAYKGVEPFSLFLKNYFRQEKKYGSNDRKAISSLCYQYFRLGHSSGNKNLHDRLLSGFFLSSTISNEELQVEQPGWHQKIGATLEEKASLLEIDVENIFPWNDELSIGIDKYLFNRSFLVQPSVFIRVRPGKQRVVRTKLATAEIPFIEVSDTCLGFANGTSLENIVDLNREAVIQDINSQRVGELLPELEKAPVVRVWDCCAASGGKSIMAYDLLSPVTLTVSDVRDSIIQNLHLRFRQAGITGYNHFVADITDPANLRASLKTTNFNLIICDAPCSGSGTWSRTPEQLLFFKKAEIDRYSRLQKSIVSNTIPYLTQQGYFLYVTCSVFQKENEEVVAFIEQQGLHLIKMKLFKGYDIKGDSMFAALFQLR